MKIEHVALWCRDLERVRDFYVGFFGGVCGLLYVNQAKGFRSYFVEFPDGARLELMHSTQLVSGSAGLGRSPGLEEPAESSGAVPFESFGLAHFAFSVGSRGAVDGLTAQLANAGFTVLSGPRTTGDGYYESCILDPEGNRVEICQ